MGAKLLQLAAIVILYVIFLDGRIERLDEGERRAVQARLDNPANSDRDDDLLDADDVFKQLRRR